MKQLDIGTEVFYIRDTKIKCSIITHITQTQENISYKLKDESFNTYFASQLFSTKQEAEKQLQEINNRFAYQIGDMVMIKESSKILIGKIVASYFDEKMNYYDCVTLSDYSSNTRCYVKECNLTLINDKYILNFGKIKKIWKKFDKHKQRGHQLIAELNNEYAKLDDDLKTGFRKINSWTAMLGLIDIKKYQDRFIMDENDEDD